MHAFQQFQQAFARHIRDPRGSARPAGVPARRMAIYNELLYNNLEGFLLACFPVSRQLLGVRRWPRLVRAFFRNWRSHTPYFREIPREFVRWLAEGELPLALPPWQAELAHYEWAELAVDVMEVETPTFDVAGDLLSGRPALNPASMNLAYAWPVQRISPVWRPRKPLATHLLVFRDAADAVRFIEFNPVSARLMTLLQAEDLTGHAACLRITAELQHPDPAAVVAHGAALLDDLRRQGAILGTLVQKSALAGRCDPHGLGQTVACSRCGTTFTCGALADEGEGKCKCWCAALPPLAATPDPAQGCLCPTCLRAALADRGQLDAAGHS